MRVLNEYVRVGVAFPAGVRQQFPTLRYSHFRNAVRVARLYSAGDGANPVWWARQASEHGWSTRDLFREGHHRLPVSDRPAPAEDVMRRAVRLAMEGQAREADIARQIREYNAGYAAITGVVLKLCRSPYVVSWES